MPIHPRQNAALVYVVDSDVGSETKYKLLFDRLGCGMRYFTSEDQALAAIDGDHPCCLILDVGCKRDDGSRLQRRLLERDADTIVMLTGICMGDRRVIEGLELGAIAMLQRPFSMHLLEDCVRFAICHHSDWLALKTKRQQFEATLSSLTVRQRKVLDYAASGIPNKAIASRLKVSQRTVEAERSKLLTAFTAESFYDVTIKIGEHRVLKELQRMRMRESLTRLGMHTTEMQPKSSPLRENACLNA